jgi:hypothetical protein
MEIAALARAWNLGPQKPRVQRKPDEAGADAESAYAGAMAEAEKVLRELSRPALHSAIEAGRSSAADEKPSEQSLVSPRSAVAHGAPRVDGLRLDSDLDFVFHDDGLIELTQAGCRRMAQAHSAGLDAVIGIDGREVLRFLAPKSGHDARAAAKTQGIQRSINGADLTEAHARRTQPVAELLRAEESTEAAVNMINKERERHEIESLLPWHAAGTLSRRDGDRVEQALAEDRELAQRYELVREELAATVHLNERLGAPSQRALKKLFAAIDAEEARFPHPRLQRCSETPAMASASP